MSTPLLSSLREPPVVGQLYMVPVIRDFPYYGRVDVWPVLGALHKDEDFFSFSEPHYHLDLRFMNSSQVRFVEQFAYDALTIVGRAPLASHNAVLPKGRPELARRKCQLSSYGHAHQHQLAVQRLNDHFGAPAKPILLGDGRKLCPHRKVDLSQFVPDADGIVTCPLHGLRICVHTSSSAASPRNAGEAVAPPFATASTLSKRKAA